MRIILVRNKPFTSGIDEIALIESDKADIRNKFLPLGSHISINQINPIVNEATIRYEISCDIISGDVAEIQREIQITFCDDPTFRRIKVFNIQALEEIHRDAQLARYYLEGFFVRHLINSEFFLHECLEQDISDVQFEHEAIDGRQGLQSTGKISISTTTVPLVPSPFKVMARLISDDEVLRRRLLRANIEDPLELRVGKDGAGLILPISSKCEVSEIEGDRCYLLRCNILA